MTRVAIVGAGVMGCAVAWALTARGADVTVHEQFDLDHDRGSSHGRSRIVRLSYPEAHWVRLAREAMDAWRELEEESGQALLDLHGIVELVSAPELTSAAGLDACGVEYSWLDAEGARAFGAVLPQGWFALLQREAGIVRTDLARQAFLDLAIARVAAWVRDRFPDVAPERSARRRASTPRRRTGRSCSSGASGPSSARRARGTGSSSRPSSDGGSRRPPSIEVPVVPFYQRLAEVPRKRNVQFR